MKGADDLTAPTGGGGSMQLWEPGKSALVVQ